MSARVTGQHRWTGTPGKQREGWSLPGAPWSRASDKGQGSGLCSHFPSHAMEVTASCCAGCWPCPQVIPSMPCPCGAWEAGGMIMPILQLRGLRLLEITQTAAETTNKMCNKGDVSAPFS